MRSNSVLATALAALASVAVAEPGRPKIYFPRQVKRQYTNTTGTAGDVSVTSVGAPLAQSTSEEPPSLGVLLSGLAGQSESKASSSPGSSSGSNNGKVTTVVIASTIVVPPKPSRTDAPSATGPESGSESGSVSSGPSSFPLSPSPSTGSNETATEVASTWSLPPLIILPTGKNTESSTSRPTGVSNSTASSQTSAYASTSESPSESSTPTSSSSSSSSGILLAPTGVVTATSSEGSPGLIGGLLSSIVSEVTDALGPTANATKTADPTKPTSAPASSDPIISLPLTLLPTGTGSPTTPPGTNPPETTIPPPVTNTTDYTTAPPTGPTTIPDLNATTTDIPVSTPPDVTSLPTTIVTISPNTTTNGNVTIPTSAPPTTSSDDEPTGVTSIPPTGTYDGTDQPWLPTTIVVDPTPTTTTTGGLAPTSAVTLPTALPKAITPESASDPQPEDTTLIQIGFGFGMNYPFVVSNSKAAAQIFRLLPQALSYAGGFSEGKVQMRKLIPLNTQQSLGYVTTLAIVTYPSSMVEALRMDVKIPSSALYNHPEQLVYNLTQQINPAIDIILGSYPEDGVAPGENGASSAATSVPNSDPFDNDSDESNSSSSQKGATAGIAFGVVGVAAAYGAAMFLIARRYKRKKQAHRRASSVSDSSGMRTVGSPPLMGGALLSRDFSSYGGVAGGRDSQGSGKSGGNSARTAVISPPMAAENSLGWN